MSYVFFLITLTLSLVMPFWSSQAEEQSVSQLEPAEALFLQWVNEARANPWAEAERLGLDVTELRNEVGELVASQWDEGLPPLLWNEQLASAATCHVQDMLDRVYYSHMSPDGLGTDERIRATGYNSMFWGESLGGVAFIKIISDEKAAHIIYKGLLKDAFRQGPEGAPLLDPLLRDIGLCLGGGQLLFENSWYNVYILTCDLGRMHEPVSDGQEGVLWGHVYQDLNGNGRYDEGEGIEGALVRLAGPVGLYGPRDPAYEFVSSRDGGYVAEVLPGSHKVNVLLRDGTVASSFRLDVPSGVLGMDLAAGAVP